MAKQSSTSAKRLDSVQDLEDLKSNPERLQRYRDNLANVNPKHSDISDEELIRVINDLQSRLDPPDIDEASEKWAMAQHWSTQSDALLSDELIEGWDITMGIRAYWADRDDT